MARADMNQQFWMVWCPQGGAPTATHLTAQAAQAEAARLASSLPGRRFYILKGLRYVEVSGLNKVELPSSDGISF